MAASAWDSWLADSLATLGIDSDVYGPYVTGIFEDTSLSSDEQTASVLDLLTEVAPSSPVPPAVETMSRRWQERVLQTAAESAAAEEALLAKYEAAKAAQRAEDEHALATRKAQMSEEALLEKRLIMAQLEGASSGDDDGAADYEDDDAKANGQYNAQLAKAREETRQRAEQRREAISRAVEREIKQKADHDARRALREQAGHIKPAGRANSGGSPASKGSHRAGGRAGGTAS